MAVITATGRMKNKATAVAAVTGPKDTRQVGVDNSLIAGMVCAVGTLKQKSTVIRP